MVTPPLLIIAEDASAVFGGEAVLPLHYFRRLRARGIDCHLLTHERNRPGLLAELPAEESRMHFVPDTRLHRWLWTVTSRSPGIVGRVVFGPVIRLYSQFIARRIAKRLVNAHGLKLIHQPAPVSPKDPSVLFGLGIPIIVGPLNGGMTYPPGFFHLESRVGRATVATARILSNLIHLLLPGKRNADLVLVANERTRKALPGGLRGRVEFLVENGVDFSLWNPPDMSPTRDIIGFAFAGRLVDWKAVDLLLHAFKLTLERTPATLDLFGDGVERPKLETIVDQLGIRHAVTFHGWVDQKTIARHLATADIFVLPSLWECGGAVVLEAMAAGVPVIATRWGGPADYLDDTCGLLIEPTNPANFTAELAAAMLRLASEPETRKRLASAALTRVRAHFDWERKIDRIVQLYTEVLNSESRPRAVPPATTTILTNVP